MIIRILRKTSTNKRSFWLISIMHKIAEIKKPLDFYKVVDEIDRNHPFIMHLDWVERTGGHAVVCAGYNLKDKTAYIIDPDIGISPNYYDYLGLSKDDYYYNGIKAICMSEFIY